MEQRMKHPWLCRSMMLLLIFTILAAYMPQATFEAFAATKASVYDGRQLKGSDGKPYYPNNKGGGFYWAKFSNLAGDGFLG